MAEMNDMKNDDDQSNWDQSAVVSCYVCMAAIDEEDFSGNNIKQTSFGLMHIQCPNKLIVSNLPASVREGSLYELFNQFGPILEIQMNGSIALIEFEKRETAKMAKAKLNGCKMGSQNLCIRFAHDNDEVEQKQNDKQQNEIQPIANRYIHSKESLRAMSAMQIVSMLVTEKKKHREVNKKWMRLMIGHQQNEDVIDFIHECKANDATKVFVDGFIPVPSYLEGLIKGESNRMK